jgi:hypothetical protein
VESEDEMKTTRQEPITSLVKAAHAGMGRNGDGGCHTRWSMPNGECSGVNTAAWLNSLGPDNANYGSGRGVRHPHTGQILTNLDVRENWVRGNSHVVWLNTSEYITCDKCQGRGKVAV